jgi:phosphoribosylformimino-5-aminoimidazole carboxamide ribotide isomerase
MLIPSIDLRGGKVVQLIQGERTAIADADLDYWIDRFRGFPIVQLIDLDAAMNAGHNDAIVRRVLRELPCQVGGGIRSVDRARELIAAGARRVIIGSALFREGSVDTAAAAAFAEAIGDAAFIAAVDCRHGQVRADGWKTATDVSPDDAIRALTPYAGRFLCTLIETEGTLCGIDIERVAQLRSMTPRGFIAAGGIRSRTEIDVLDSLGADAVVGMAIYTGRMLV